MATITQHTTKNGTIRHRAIIRINTAELKHTESKTFSKRSLAEAWAKKREAEIELNPASINKPAATNLRFKDAIIRYLGEMSDNFGRSHKMGIDLIGRFAIGDQYIDKLTHDDFARFAQDRLDGKPPSAKPVSPSTLAGDMVMIRSVLRHAKYVWGIETNLVAFEEVIAGLRYARNVKGSKKRHRLPTNDELRQLSDYFYNQWQKHATFVPMHHILWFAIYSCRRESEIIRLKLSDLYDDSWLLRDAKNPKGSKGNHKNIKVTDDALALIKHIRQDPLRHKMTKGKFYDPDLLFGVSAKTVSRLFTEACRMLGIEDLHFHDLRHEGATRLAEQGLTIPQMQQVTGHDSWSSLQRYTNLKPRPAVLTWQDALLAKPKKVKTRSVRA